MSNGDSLSIHQRIARARPLHQLLSRFGSIEVSFAFAGTTSVYGWSLMHRDAVNPGLQTDSP